MKSENVFNYEVILANGEKFGFYFTNRDIEELLKSYNIEYKVYRYIDGVKKDVTDEK